MFGSVRLSHVGVWGLQALSMWMRRGWTAQACACAINMAGATCITSSRQSALKAIVVVGNLAQTTLAICLWFVPFVLSVLEWLCDCELGLADVLPHRAWLWRSLLS